MFGKTTVESLDGSKKFHLVVYILESIVELEGQTVATYGIQIDKLNLDESEILESEKICDIAPDKAEIEKLARELLDGTVEPKNLFEIVSYYVDSPAYLRA